MGFRSDYLPTNCFRIPFIAVITATAISQMGLQTALRLPPRPLSAHSRGLCKSPRKVKGSSGAAKGTWAVLPNCGESLTFPGLITRASLDPVPSLPFLPIPDPFSLVRIFYSLRWYFSIVSLSWTEEMSCNCRTFNLHVHCISSVKTSLLNLQ